MTSLNDITEREYTPNEIGKICRMSCMTVKKCYRKGELKGVLVRHSKMKFLRVSYQNLVEFMEGNNIPLDLLMDYHGLAKLPNLNSH